MKAKTLRIWISSHTHALLVELWLCNLCVYECHAACLPVRNNKIHPLRQFNLKFNFVIRIHCHIACTKATLWLYYLFKTYIRLVFKQIFKLHVWQRCYFKAYRTCKIVCRVKWALSQYIFWILLNSFVKSTT